MYYFLLSVLFLCGMSAPFFNGIMVLYDMHYLKTKSVRKSLVRTCRTVAVILYMMLYQKLQKNVVVVKKEEYDILYVLHEQLYKIRVHAKRGPYHKRILQVINENDEDVTVDVQPYLGPQEDFHGLLYEPAIIGYKQLTFNMDDGTTKSFESGQVIKLD